MNITNKWLETCGSLSLEGCLYEAGIQEPQEVTLWFEQARPEPEVILMNDFVPACLVQSIVNLMGKGYRFRIETYPKGAR